MKKAMKKGIVSLALILMLTVSSVASRQVLATGDGTEQTGTTENSATTENQAGDEEVATDETLPAGDEAVTGEVLPDGQINPDGQVNPDGAAVEGNRRDGTVETVPTHIGEGYVLGARRSQTGEESQLSSIVIIAGVACLLGVLVAIGRKKKNDDDK